MDKENRPSSASQASIAKKLLASQGLLTTKPTATERALAGLSVTGQKIELRNRQGLGGRKKTKRNRRSKRTRRSQKK